MKQADFERLIDGWLEANVISPEQAEYMRRDLQTETSEQSGKKFIAIIATLGAAVLVAGVLLVIASNWQALGKPIQLILALLMPVGPLYAAYQLIEVKRNPTILGKVANIFGVGLIGGSLALIGQIYNLESGYTSLLWMWALLSLPFVFVFRRTENVVLTALLVGTATLAAIVEWFDWREAQAFVLTLTIAALAYAAFMYLIGTSLRFSPVWSGGARGLRLMSASVASVTLFVTTFEFYARLVTDAGYRSFSWVPLSIIFNLVFIGFMVYVLIKAFRHQEERLAVSVVRTLFIYVIVKYFTLFSDMLDTGILLIFGGVLFIGGAWYLEKNKSRLLALMRDEVAPAPPPENAFAPRLDNDSRYE